MRLGHTPRVAAAVATIGLVVGACTIQQDLTPRVDAVAASPTPGDAAEKARERPKFGFEQMRKHILIESMQVDRKPAH